MVSKETRTKLRELSKAKFSYDFYINRLLEFYKYFSNMSVDGIPMFSLFPEPPKKELNGFPSEMTTIRISNYNKRKLDELFWYLKSNDEAIRTLSDYYDRYFSLKIFNETNPPDLFQNMYQNLIKSDNEFSKHTKTVRVTHDTRHIFKHLYFHKGSIDFKLFVLITFYKKNH